MHEKPDTPCTEKNNKAKQNKQTNKQKKTKQKQSMSIRSGVRSTQKAASVKDVFEKHSIQTH